MVSTEKIKVAHLGIATEPIPELVAAQLKLPKGTALAVQFVEPNSPAAAAGLKKNDVLIKIDDQLLVNTPQLQVLIRLHKAGDEVKLTFIREGQSQTATAKLAEKEVPKMMPPMMGGPMGGPMNMPHGPGQFQWQMQAPPPPPQCENSCREIKCEVIQKPK